MGIGTSTTPTQASKVPAQLTLSALNMYVAKRGKTAPARERRKVFAAMADAALCGEGQKSVWDEKGRGGWGERV